MSLSYQWIIGSHLVKLEEINKLFINARIAKLLIILDHHVVVLVAAADFVQEPLHLFLIMWEDMMYDQCVNIIWGHVRL